jgi:hypothetical protein
MKRDLLKDATAALSQSGHDQSGGQFTRERVVATLHDQKRRGKARRAFLIPLAAIFVGSTALAGVGGSLSVMVRSALDAVGVVSPTEVVSGDDAPAPASRAKPAKRGTAGLPAPPAEPVVAPPAEPAAEAASESAAAESTDPAPRRRSAAVEQARAVPQQVEDGHEVYRKAHRAHFRQGDVASALADYDLYLAQQPDGRFAVDARYNRALCLVRLGRHEEAKRALEPFASGSHGGYRQADATRLLAALEH